MTQIGHTKNGPPARQIIEARIGRNLPPTRDLPRDYRLAIKLLAIHLIKKRAAIAKAEGGDT